MAIPRLVALFFAVLAQTSGFLQLDSTLSAERRIIAGAATAVLIFDTLWVYATGRTSQVEAVLAGPVVVAAAQALLVRPAGVALALSALAIHSFHGSNRQAAIRTTSLTLGLVSVPFVTGILGTPDTESSLLPFIPIPIFLMFSALMRTLNNTLQKQRQIAARQACLARTGRELLGVTDPDTVREIITVAAAELCRLTPGLELSLGDSAGPVKVLVVTGPPPAAEIVSVVDTLAAQLSLAEASCAAQAESARLSNSAIVRANHETARRGALLEEAQRIAGVGSFVVEPATGRLEWSAELHRIFGTQACGGHAGAGDADQRPDAGEFQPSLEIYYQLVHPSDRAVVETAISCALSSGEPYDLEHRLVTPSGEVRVMRARGRTEVDDDGTVVRLSCTEMDVTEARQAEDDLKNALAAAGEARDQAVRANAAKSAFLASMSHELRTPMHAVLGLAGLLRDTELNAGQADLLNTITSSADQLLKIINDILDFSKSEARELDLEYRPVQLRDLVSDVMAPLMRSAHGLDVGVVVEDDCPVAVVTDPGRLRQVIGHLVGNAIKFTGHGSVRLRVSCQNPHPAQSYPDRESREGSDDSVVVRFDVQDTGIGISSGSHDRLFQPFSQVDDSNTRRYGGAGLGLVISRAVARAMGGDIEVESVPGAGSTFSFTVLATPVPADVEPDAETRATQPARAVQASPEPPSPGTATQELALRILLAEDNEINQKVARLMLGKLGHTAQIASNGEEAVEAARAATFDVILMDLHMPVMDGLEATRSIRAQLPPGQQPRIIAMTASVTLEDRDACRDAGMDGFLGKPVRHEDLSLALTGAGASY